ncbi:hypothetical protein RB195_000047 [Necator americanus]
MFRTILATVLLAEPALGVINGHSASPSETRSLVRLTSTFPHFDHEQAICGGVLISQNALLTAAHCVYDRNVHSALVTLTLSSYHPKAPKKVSIQFSKAVNIHSDFSELSRGDPDMAIVYLSHPFKCEAKYGPEVARLPFQVAKKGRYITWSNPISDKEIYDANCFATGWGITKNGTFATTPQRINLQLVQDELNGLIGYPVEDNIRACQGDSGSPVYCHISGIKYLIGIITDIGSFKSEIPISKGKLECELYDFVLISDIRKNAVEIGKILRSRGQSNELVISQSKCLKDH